MISENLTWHTHLKHMLPHFLIYILLAFLLARFWCGWVCPLGTLGDVLSSLRRSMRFDHASFTPRFRANLRVTGYGLLIGSLVISWMIGMESLKKYDTVLFLPYCQVCPARLISPLFGWTVPCWKEFSGLIPAIFTILSWAVLALFLAAFLVGRRIWCHVCPIGIITSWFNRGGALALRKDGTRCNRCGACADACPMGCSHVRDEKEKQVLNRHDCIFCFRCVEQCPQDGCLSATFFGGRVASSSFETTN